MTLLRVLACFLALVLLSNCKEVDSTPVFDAGRLTSAELDALVGTYREEPANDATILTVRRADAATDLLRFEWGKERASGQAVVSRVGTSDIFVALINMESHGFVASNAGNSIILLKRSTPDRLEVLIGDYLDPLYDGIEAITHPQLEEAFILSYIEKNAAALERQSGPVYVKVGASLPGFGPAGPLQSVDGLFVVSDFAISQLQYTGARTAAGAPLFDEIIIRLPGPGHFSGRTMRGASLGDVSGRGAWFPDTQQFYSQSRAFGAGTRCMFFTDPEWSTTLVPVDIPSLGETEIVAYRHSRTYAEGRRSDARQCLRPQISERSCQMVGCLLWSDEDRTGDWDITYVTSLGAAIALFEDPLR